MRFELLDRKALRRYWAQIRAGLDLMPDDDWIAEDVYAEVRFGGAAMHVVMQGDQFLGFLALQVKEAEFSGKSILHVWLAYNAGSVDVISEGEQLIRDTAKRINASKITFGSPRKGWAKRYSLVTATYEIPQ